MSSLTDGREQNNDELTRTDAQPTGAVPKNLRDTTERPSPIATDFSRVAIRFMMGGREWTRNHRDRALDALRRSVVPWSGIFWITFWRWRGFLPFTGTFERPGHGEEREMTIPQYAEWLAEWARGTYPKGESVSTTLARSRYRGHSDDECTLRSGFLLDSDECGGWEASRELCDDIGVAFVRQMRPTAPNRHHLELWLAKPMVPERDDSGVTNWKQNVYCPTFGWTLGIVSELAALRFEPFWDKAGRASAKYAGYDGACDQLTHLTYPYTRRPNDPPGVFPVTDYATGGALDIDALLGLTDFQDAHARLHQPIRYAGRVASVTRPSSASGYESSQRTRPLGLEEIDPKIELLVRLRTLAKPESQEIINHCLKGRPFAERGQRDHTMWRIASIVAALAPAENPEELARLVFTRALEATAKLADAEPRIGYVKVKLALAAEKIARAQRKLTGGVR